MAIFINSPETLTGTDSASQAFSLGQLSNATLNDAIALQELPVGETRFPVILKTGMRDIVLTVSSYDFSEYDTYEVGELFTNLVLTARGISCTDTQAESTITITLSKAVLTEKGDVSIDANGDVASFTMTFKVAKSCTDVSDPTLTIVVS